MYTRQEISRMNQEFWTSFGLYMSPVPSAEGLKINWVNYKTGVKNVRLRLWAENKSGGLSLAFSNPDVEIQKKWAILFADISGEFLQEYEARFRVYGLQDAAAGDGFQVKAEQTGMDIMNKEDWPAIIPFLKSSLVTIDEFWCRQRELFEMVT